MFRGCAGNYFPHDEKCEIQEQAVTIVEGKKSVDVGVTLCYCNKDLCNEEFSRRYGNTVPRTHYGKIATMLYAVLGIPVYILYFKNMGKVSMLAMYIVYIHQSFTNIDRCLQMC